MRLFRPALAIAAIVSLAALAGCAAEETPSPDNPAVSAPVEPSEVPTPFALVASEDTIALAEKTFRDFVAETANPTGNWNTCEGSPFIQENSFDDIVPTFIGADDPIEVAHWDKAGQYRLRAGVTDADGDTGTGLSQMVVEIKDGKEPCIVNFGGYGWK